MNINFYKKMIRTLKREKEVLIAERDELLKTVEKLGDANKNPNYKKKPGRKPAATTSKPNSEKAEVEETNPATVTTETERAPETEKPKTVKTKKTKRMKK